MSLVYGYLTPKQLKMWSLFSKKLKQTEIADILGITKQTVNKSLSIIERKVSKALHDAAKINRIVIRKMDPIRGFLLGYSEELKTDVVIFLSAKHGLQVWFKTGHVCKGCTFYKECRRIILDELKDRGIKLSEKEEGKEPSQLAEILFKHIIEEV